MTANGAKRVLVVDDDLAVGLVLSSLLGQAGYETHRVGSGEEAIAALLSRPFDAVLTDVRMPGLDGMELLERIKERTPELPVVLITAHGSVPMAVEAMRHGAANFLLKPFDRDEVLFTIERAIRTSEASALKPPEPEGPKDREMLGVSEPMRECMERLRRVALTTATVLLRGESGTGKEVAARTIHALSPRAKQPLITVHCAALPETLLESELFGYEKGAFTGATQKRPGRVSLAHGGALFLDEIGEVSPTVQVKLLRLLQEKEYQPVGSNRAEKADIRFIAATNRHLETMVREGTFREDLFYRLNVVPIWMPPLRERRDDIPHLATRFVKEIGASSGRPDIRLSESALDALRHYDWPGNVRELQNFLERLVVFSDSPIIDDIEVQGELKRSPGPLRAEVAGSGEYPARTMSPGGAATPSSPPPTGTASSTLGAHRIEAERTAVLDALQRSEGNRTRAARLLGVSRRTLYNKLNELEIA